MNKRDLALAAATILLVLVLAVDVLQVGEVGIGDYGVTAYGVVINGRKVLGGTAYVNELRATDSTGLELNDVSGIAGLFVRNGGNVGIGDATPDAGFEVSRTTRYQNTADSTTAYQWHDSDGGAFVNFDSDNERAAIGDTSPEATWEVSGTTRYQTVADTTTSYQWYDQNGGVPILSIDATNERVGIGTAAPGAELEVFGTNNPQVNAKDDSGVTAMLGAQGAPPQVNIGSRTANQVNFVVGTAGKMMLLTNGNLGIGTTSPNVTLDVTPTIGIGNPTAPGGNGISLVFQNSVVTPTVGATDTALMFAIGDPSELWVSGGGGVLTKISTHSEEFMDSDSPFPWTFEAESAVLGKRVGANITGALHDLEAITGKTYITYTDIATMDWDDWQAEIGVAVNAERLAEASAVMVEVAQRDATEQYTVTATVEVTPTQYVTTTTTTYELDAVTGNSIEVLTIVTTTVTEEVETGTAWRLKAGCQLDTDDGKFYCPVGEGDAVYDAYVPSVMPEWMADRIGGP